MAKTALPAPPSNFPPVSADSLGTRLKAWRRRSDLTLRQLAKAASVTPAMLSTIERGKSSPSIAVLQRIVSGLGTDLGRFFSTEEAHRAGPVYRREHMRLVCDEERHYILLFPGRDDIHMEMMDEMLFKEKARPPYETLKCDMAGYILQGLLTFEIKGRPAEQLRPGDAFYVPRGLTHRGYAASDEPVRLVTVCTPAKY